MRVVGIVGVACITLAFVIVCCFAVSAMAKELVEAIRYRDFSEIAFVTILGLVGAGAVLLLIYAIMG